MNHPCSLLGLKATDALTEVAWKVRTRLFSSQSQAATHLPLTRATISRYEGGELKPPLGYLALLVQLRGSADLHPGADTATHAQLLAEFNPVIHRFYQDHPALRSWAELNALAEAYQAERKQGQTGSPPHAPPPEAAPGRAAGSASLPQPITSFIGRYAECAAIQQQLQTARLLTLTGPGGCGKTRLAIQIATDLAAQFPDGVYFVNLAPVNDPALVASTIAQTLGVRETGGQSLLDCLKQELRSKQLLLVLDNFEHLLAAAPLVAELLTTTAHVKALVTSRALLHIYGEHNIPVPPLPFPDPAALPPFAQVAQYSAVRLFVERAQATKPDFALTSANAGTVVEICARLDGLPLALELAAARIRILPPAALLRRLTARLAVASGGGVGLPERQQTLHATIAWSYELLDAEEQRLFGRLAVFQGGRTLEAIEAVCNTAGDLPFGVLEGMTALMDRSLAQQHEGVGGEPRFVMLETIHEFAHDRLEDSGESEELAQRHVAWFLALAEEAARQLTGNNQAIWLALLEEEQPNLRVALEFSCGPIGSPDMGLRLAIALFRFWGVRGHFSEGRAWFQRILAAAQARGSVDPLRRAQALNAAGALAHLQSDYVAGRRLGEEALVLFREIKDRPGTASALRNLVILAIEQRALNEARALGEECLAIYRELGDQAGMAMILSNLGQVAQEETDLETAASFHAQALQLQRHLEHKRGIAVSLNNLGLVRHEQGQLHPARAMFEEAQALLTAVGDQLGTAVVLTNLANLLQEQGDHRVATDLHLQNLKLFAKQGNTMRIAETLEGLAGAAVGLDQPARAVRLLAAAAALREVIEVPLTVWGRQLYERYQEAARRHLDPPAWEAAWEEGHLLDQAHAVAYALEAEVSGA